MAAIEQVFTIEAEELFRRNGIAAVETLLIPITLILRTRIHSSSVAFSTVPIAPIPALFTRTSIVSVSVPMRLNAAITSALSPTSQAIHVATSDISPSLRSRPKTLAPWA